MFRTRTKTCPEKIDLRSESTSVHSWDPAPRRNTFSGGKSAGDSARLYKLQKRFRKFFSEDPDMKPEDDVFRYVSFEHSTCSALCPYEKVLAASELGVAKTACVSGITAGHECAVSQIYPLSQSVLLDSRLTPSVFPCTVVVGHTGNYRHDPPSSVHSAEGVDGVYNRPKTTVLS
ncbi:unnamed protein product [Clavelina lepadiformis]|uniref:Uncharacterized protein n=1 Tax=Clavelina lepadiformis TaxID=159417 RepID=A0ABP0F4P3_CLALP